MGHRQYESSFPDPMKTIASLLLAAALSGCVHTVIELPNNGGRYSSTTFLATRRADKIVVTLGDGKGVTVDGYGQSSTEVAKAALATAQAALNKSP